MSRGFCRLVNVVCREGLSVCFLLRLGISTTAVTLMYSIFRFFGIFSSTLNEPFGNEFFLMLLWVHRVGMILLGKKYFAWCPRPMPMQMEQVHWCKSALFGYSLYLYQIEWIPGGTTPCMHQDYGGSS